MAVGAGLAVIYSGMGSGGDGLEPWCASLEALRVLENALPMWGPCTRM